jgi:hypothetical protein
MASVVFAVDTYSYVIHTPGDPDYLVFDGKMLKVRGVIDCVGQGHHGYVIALADDSPLPFNRYDAGGEAVWIFSRLDQFPWHIDMLRNEKPVFCHGSFTPPAGRRPVKWKSGTGTGFLSTSDEPVGEGER